MILYICSIWVSRLRLSTFQLRLCFALKFRAKGAHSTHSMSLFYFFQKYLSFDFATTCSAEKAQYLSLIETTWYKPSSEALTVRLCSCETPCFVSRTTPFLPLDGVVLLVYLNIDQCHQAAKGRCMNLRKMKRRRSTKFEQNVSFASLVDICDCCPAFADSHAWQFMNGF